jgi:EAL domain-containing protein (putative c-di-GMP-specific phosphodiesterase class I)
MSREMKRETTFARAEPGVATALARRIDPRGLVVSYQPRVSLRGGRLAGFEARLQASGPIPLVRDENPEIGRGRRALHEACHQLTYWHRDFPARPPLEIGVNTSPEYLAHPSLILDVESVLADTGLPPASVRLEMNERSIMLYSETAKAALHRLGSIGIGLEISGFGTGNESLGYLRKLPFDTLRIDRSFVKELGMLNDSSKIIETILTFARSLGMSVDAEGVETKDQVDRLIALGCRRGQGLYFSGPVSAAVAEELIRY